ncbi:hypothetical protein E2C01_087475 [Portunus trituberculatus]|uniref:Uncharacterized protein n=1 Tax=Portunus trituberculatus TaxID=210409 RepID=A0A5B7JGF9_PORTR|nr:hypothetical protein [Portunus trituberculatus]
MNQVGRRGTVEPYMLWGPRGLQAHGFESCPRSECRLGFLTRGNGFLAAPLTGYMNHKTFVPPLAMQPRVVHLEPRLSSLLPLSSPSDPILYNFTSETLWRRVLTHTTRLSNVPFTNQVQPQMDPVCGINQPALPYPFNG